MTRKLISLAGVLVAVFSFTVGGADVEARHGRGHRHRCCQEFGNNGYQQHAHPGYSHAGNNGSCCQQNANTGHVTHGQHGYQQTSNYGPGPVTYGTTGAAIDAGQPAPAIQTTAPVPNN